MRKGLHTGWRQDGGPRRRAAVRTQRHRPL